MRSLLTVLLLALTIPTLAVETVESVDLSRYLGKWYEISSIPNSFQRKCIKNTTAEYKALDYGKIDVKNSCVKENGSPEIANGIAQVVSPDTNAELKVSFVPFFNHFGWFAGQYKILVLDSDYQYVVVGEDKLKYGWILARTTNLDTNVLAQLEKEIRRLGYDSCEFLMTTQDGGDYSNKTPLCQAVKE